MPRVRDPFEDTTGVVLVGGQSRRMGTDKALMPMSPGDGRPLYQAIVATLAEVLPRVILAGGPVARFAGSGLPVHPDRFPGSSLGGLYTGLSQARTPYVFVLACDMPFVPPGLIRGLLSLRPGADAVVPRRADRVEPLCAVYSRACLPHMRRLLEEGGHRILDFFSEVRVRYLEGEDLDRLDPEGRAFINLNTPEDLRRFRADTGGSR